MGLPSKLKDLNAFGNGNSWLGQVAEVTVPKLARQMEDYRGGGMQGPVKIDMGMQAVECEWKAGGLLKDALRQFAAATIDAHQLRFVGSFENDSTGRVEAVEVIIRGRHEEIDMGSWKAGDDTVHAFKTACSYYKLVINNIVEIEYDALGMILTIGGVDRLKERRKALGIAGGPSVSIGLNL